MKKQITQVSSKLLKELDMSSSVATYSLRFCTLFTILSEIRGAFAHLTKPALKHDCLYLNTHVISHKPQPPSLSRQGTPSRF